jgi:type II secretory pathway pseudopilin PulG
MSFNPGGPQPTKQGLAIASLVLGILSLPTLGCLGVGALVSVALGVLALVKANREPHVYGGKGLAIGGIVASALSLLVAIPLGGIVAAIAIPSLLRARVSANESAAIGDIRTVISAQAAYQASNCGAYGPPECLATPSAPGCLTDYTGPTFLDAQLASLQVKSGYRRTFHPGNPLTADTGCPGAKGLESFAFVAVPDSRQTGVRAFCGDSSGVVCSTLDGTIPNASGTGCGEGCELLR